jgi:hypothetical protein
MGGAALLVTETAFPSFTGFDVTFEDGLLAVDVDAVAPSTDVRADIGGLDAFDFPLSVEWWKYKFSTSLRDCRC